MAGLLSANCPCAERGISEMKPISVCKVSPKTSSGARHSRGPSIPASRRSSLHDVETLTWRIKVPRAPFRSLNPLTPRQPQHS